MTRPEILAAPVGSSFFGSNGFRLRVRRIGGKGIFYNPAKKSRAATLMFVDEERCLFYVLLTRAQAYQGVSCSGKLTFVEEIEVAEPRNCSDGNTRIYNRCNSRQSLLFLEHGAEGSVNVLVPRRQLCVVLLDDIDAVAEPDSDFVDAGSGSGVETGEGVAHDVRSDP